MSEEVLKKAFIEVNEILSYLPTEYVKKIPDEIKMLFENAKLKDYQFNLNPYKKIEEQELDYNTKIILVMLYRNYWCNENEKEKIDKLLFENDLKREIELKQKYNYNNLFKNIHSIDITKEKNPNLPTEIKKEGFIKRIYSKIKKWIKIGES